MQNENSKINRIIGILFIVVISIVIISILFNMFFFKTFSFDHSNQKNSSVFNNLTWFDNFYIYHKKIISLISIIFYTAYLFAAIGLVIKKYHAKIIFVSCLLISIAIQIIKIINHIAYIFKGVPAINKNIIESYDTLSFGNYNQIFYLTHMVAIFISMFFLCAFTVVILIIINKIKLK